VGLTKLSRRHVAQRLMGPLRVVVFEPLFRLLSDLREGLENLHIKHRLAVAAVVSFNEAIIHGLPRLNSPFDPAKP
jgi:hypothetical protein